MQMLMKYSWIFNETERDNIVTVNEINSPVCSGADSTAESTA